MAASVRAGKSSAADSLKAAFETARYVDAGRDGLNIILHSNEEKSIANAKAAAKKETATEDLGLLVGVPVAVKDNIATFDLPTSCGSRILEKYVSPYEATVITRLREHGAVVMCKTNMDEFAMGSSNENSAYGPVRNPVDPSRVPGGSSGGSAAAVAAGIVPLALGSETGGSVRQPAALCGVVGVKPTYGRVSRYGLVAFASSLDQIGVLGGTVDDTATAMEIISGYDPLDSTSSDEVVPVYRAAELGADPPPLRTPSTTAVQIGRTDLPEKKAAGKPLDGMVIGKPKEYFPDSLDAAMRDRCERSLDHLRALGATVRDVSLPRTDLAIPVYYILATAEASSNLARFDGVRYGLRVNSEYGLRGMYEATRTQGFGREVVRRIMLGTYVLSAGYYDAYYKKAQAVRTLITEDFLTVFKSGVHALFTPTTPSPAFPIGAVTDPIEMYLNDIFTCTANLSGNPAMSIPIGRINGLPAGGQIIAPHFGEYAMFRVAYALEKALGAEAHK
jgi:aspartyl-tRNA(Asn)/glutamyl-tRNA(Gln) amidotransferase subunit A